MITNKLPTLITIVGPTAIGKTAMSIRLAKNYQTAIVSCDSRQFFKEMAIGTAVPEPNELAAAKHYFIQNKSIFDSYNVGEFERDALAKITELHKNNTNLIMVGGSGLYVDAVLKGLDYFPEISPKIRDVLTQELQEHGIEVLQKKLKKLDIESYQTIELQNPHRVMRALEICIGTGKPYSVFKNKPKKPRNFNSIKIGLLAEREIIYNRINERVDIMIQNGLIEEAKKLYQYKNLNALQTVGYKELFMYFEGNYTLDFAISEIKKNTRRFAKRQLTWFKKDSETLWFDYKTPYETIVTAIDAEKEKFK
ncbi:tRNA (adenosine(37)-N6)-dimethylallyltransferase MiaA [Polaribacter tangerinus]|uniref:tRNA (adenosine(37)-N6)-dimethylallyltransferase MiaA n=1 Tax=Polaribacter tangerinus TaxID=1920034 RepID=UPI000B4AC9ED|nr:tRNA (adenosine(37)-N6)-dimethylallyltransferase MiaA [Polaribacter tangerinus]